MELRMKELAEAREAVREAGRLLRENLAGRGEVSFKGAVDLVTAFDRQAQELVDRRLADTRFCEISGENKEE